MPRHSKTDIYKTYYVNQAKQRGGNLPAFHGGYAQQGYGLGSMLRGLFRWALPHVSAGAQSLGRQALKGGLAVAQDVASGQNLKQSFKKRAQETGQAVMNDVLSSKTTQSGAGRKGTKRLPSQKAASSRQVKKTKTSHRKKENFTFF